MKRLRKLAQFVVLSSVAAISAARASEPDWQTTVDFQIVSMPSEIGVTLLPQLLQPDKADAAIALLRKQITEGAVEVLAQPRAFLSADGETLSSTERDYRYPVEFAPPIAMGHRFSKWPTVASVFGFSAALPSTIETRDLGEGLVVHGQVSSDGRTIELRVDLRRKVLAGSYAYAGGKTAGGVVANVEQPHFFVRRFTGALTLVSGRWQFAGAFPLKDGRHEIFLLRATARRLGPPAKPAPKQP